MDSEAVPKDGADSKIPPEACGEVPLRLDSHLPVLDRGFLDDLEMAARVTGNLSLPSISLKLFRQSGLLGKIRAGVTAGDAKTLTDAAHALKSSSGSLGAIRVSTLCDRMQLLGRSGTLEGAAELLEAIEREYAAAVAALRLGIPQQ